MYNQARVHTLTLATGPKTGGGYVYGEALAQVMRDLDDKQFELEDVQTFSFGWDKAMASLRSRQSMMLAQPGQRV